MLAHSPFSTKHLAVHMPRKYFNASPRVSSTTEEQFCGNRTSRGWKKILVFFFAARLQWQKAHFYVLAQCLRQQSISLSPMGIRVVAVFVSTQHPTYAWRNRVHI